MRVGRGRLFQVFVHAPEPALVDALQLDFHPRALRHVPLDRLLLEDLRLVLGGVDDDLVVVSRLLGRDAGGDADRLAGGQVAVHAGRADADALLASAHLQPVELAAVEQLAEDAGYLLPDDARAVVRHRDAEALLAGGLLDGDGDIGQDAGLFAGVEGVVHGLLDGGQQGAARVVEPEQVAVLGEELADADLALLLGHVVGGQVAARLFAAFFCRINWLGRLRLDSFRIGLQRVLDHHELALIISHKSCP